MVRSNFGLITNLGFVFQKLIVFHLQLVVNRTILVSIPTYFCPKFTYCFFFFFLFIFESISPTGLPEIAIFFKTHQVNYIKASVTLLTSCLGTFIGGYITKRLKMTAETACRFCLVIVVLSLTFNLAGLAFYCDQPPTVGGPDSPLSCAGNCTCADNSYFPICGDDGVTYYSPCFAGCDTFDNITKSYSNCACIRTGRDQGLTGEDQGFNHQDADSMSERGGATPGVCPYQCGSLYPYVASFALRSLIGTMWIIPKLIVVIRCVSEKDKTLAMGYYAFLTSLLGWMLGPIIFGNFIDTICDVWDVTCGQRGRCLRYYHDVFRIQVSVSGTTMTSLEYR